LRRGERVTRLDAQGDVTDRREVLERVRLQQQKARLIAVSDPTDFARWKNRLRRFLHRDPKEGAIVEDAEAADVLDLVEDGLAGVGAERDRRACVLQQLQVVTECALDVGEAVRRPVAQRGRYSPHLLLR